MVESAPRRVLRLLAIHVPTGVPTMAMGFLAPAIAPRAVGGLLVLGYLIFAQMPSVGTIAGVLAVAVPADSQRSDP